MKRHNTTQQVIEINHFFGGNFKQLKIVLFVKIICYSVILLEVNAKEMMFKDDKCKSFSHLRHKI